MLRVLTEEEVARWDCISVEREGAGDKWQSSSIDKVRLWRKFVVGDGGELKTALNAVSFSDRNRVPAGSRFRLLGDWYARGWKHCYRIRSKGDEWPFGSIGEECMPEFRGCDIVGVLCVTERH